MTPIQLPTVTLNQLRDGTALWLLPVVPQPERQDGAWYWYSERYDNGDGIHYFHTVVLDGVMDAWRNACPHSAGDVLRVQEEWRQGVDDYGRDCVQFRDTTMCPADFIRGALSKLHASKSHIISTWRPAETMPEWACRLSVRVVEVRRPVQVKDVSEEMAIQVGFDPIEGDPGVLWMPADAVLMEWWQREHPDRSWAWPVGLETIKAAKAGGGPDGR